MPRNYNRYQYETSPRKIEPEYTPKKVPYKKKKTTARNLKKEKQINKKTLEIKKKQKTTLKYIAVGFVILFAITYRHAQIDENFSKVQELKDELAMVKKENTQLEINVEDSLNYSNLEQQAKELLGMQKLNPKQTTYITLPKSDYIEASAEKVELNESKSFFENLMDKIKNIF